jgi:putative oligomerization/nucleic acid binding protein
MRIVHLIRKPLGTLLAVACFGLALYALFRLVQGGSCASGGNYVSARQCRPGTGWWAAELPLGIIGGLLFLGIGYIKMGRPEQTPPQPAAQMFTSDGGRPAGWPSHLPWPPAGVDWQNAVVVGTQGNGPAADQDPLARLERLRALRDADALTAAEYDAAKAKILSQM